MTKNINDPAPRPGGLLRWLMGAFLLLILGGCAYAYYFMTCLDGCGPYHNTTSLADLDGDGNLDVALFNRRHNGETTIWSGATLWTNRDGKNLIPSGPLMPELPAAAYHDTLIADVDQDGRADLLVLMFNQLRFYLNQASEPAAGTSPFRMDGSVQGPEEASLSNTLVLGDLDNDGDLDGFVAGCCGMLMEDMRLKKTTYSPSYSWIWINELAEGGRLEGRSHSLRKLGDLAIRQIALGDLDGDGDLDAYAAVVASRQDDAGAPADRIWLNDGEGNFQDSGLLLAATETSDSPTDRLVARLDTGLRDLFNVLEGNGPHQLGSTAVALGDLDGDGDLDVLAGHRAGVQIWINQGGNQAGQEGTFEPATQRITGGPTEAVFLADLDGDGGPEALVAGRNRAEVWWNRGGEFMLEPGQSLRYTEKHGLAVDDFNGDGYLDVFSAAYDVKSHLWLNQGDGRLLEVK
jgi:hypothetical protein